MLAVNGTLLLGSNFEVAHMGAVVWLKGTYCEPHSWREKMVQFSKEIFCGIDRIHSLFDARGVPSARCVSNDVECCLSSCYYPIFLVHGRAS